MSFADIRLLNRNMMHDYAVMQTVARIPLAAALDLLAQGEAECDGLRGGQRL